MQEQHLLEPFMGHAPLVLQPGTNQPVPMDFLQRACESLYQILSGKPLTSLFIRIQELPLDKIGR